MTWVGNSVMTTIWRPCACLQDVFWNSSLLTPSVYPASLTWFLMFSGEAGVKCSCSGAGTRLASFPFSFTLLSPRWTYFWRLSWSVCVSLQLSSSESRRGSSVRLCALSLLGGQQHTFLSAAPDYYCKNADMWCDVENKWGCHLAEPTLQLLFWLSISLWSVWIACTTDLFIF